MPPAAGIPLFAMILVHCVKKDKEKEKVQTSGKSTDKWKKYRQVEKVQTSGKVRFTVTGITVIQ